MGSVVRDGGAVARGLAVAPSPWRASLALSTPLRGRGNVALRSFAGSGPPPEKFFEFFDLPTRGRLRVWGGEF